MKIVLTTNSLNLDSVVDPRFGRSACFIVVNPDTMEWQALPNPGVGASGGAGTPAAQFVANQNAEAVISGDFGPNAYNALQTARIAMYLVGAGHTRREAIDFFKVGKLERVVAPTGQGRPRQG